MLSGKTHVFWVIWVMLPLQLASNLATGTPSVLFGTSGGAPSSRGRSAGLSAGLSGAEISGGDTARWSSGCKRRAAKAHSAKPKALKPWDVRE